MYVFSAQSPTSSEMYGVPLMQLFCSIALFNYCHREQCEDDDLWSSTMASALGNLVNRHRMECRWLDTDRCLLGILSSKMHEIDWQIDIYEMTIWGRKDFG